MMPGLRWVLLAAAFGHTPSRVAVQDGQLAEDTAATAATADAKADAALASMGAVDPTAPGADGKTPAYKAGEMFALLQMRQRHAHAEARADGKEGARVDDTVRGKTNDRQDKELSKLMKLNAEAYKNFTTWDENDNAQLEADINQQDRNVSQSERQFRDTHEDTEDKWDKIFRQFKKSWEKGKRKSTDAFQKQNEIAESAFAMVAKVIAYQKKKFDGEKARIVAAKGSVSAALTSATTQSSQEVKQAGKLMDTYNRANQKGIATARRKLMKDMAESPIITGIVTLNKALETWIAEQGAKSKSKLDEARGLGADLSSQSSQYNGMLMSYAAEMRGARDSARNLKNKHTKKLAAYTAATKKNFEEGAKQVQGDLTKLAMEQDAGLSAIDAEHQQAMTALEDWTSEWKAEATKAQDMSEKEFMDWLDANNIDLETLQSLLEGTTGAFEEGLQQISSKHDDVEQQLEQGYTDTMGSQGEDYRSIQDEVRGNYKELRSETIEETNAITTKATQAVADAQPQVSQVLDQVKVSKEGMETRLKAFQLRDSEFNNHAEHLDASLQEAAKFFNGEVLGADSADEQAFRDLKALVQGNEQSLGSAYGAAADSISAQISKAQADLQNEKNAAQGTAAEAAQSMFDLFGTSAKVFEKRVDSKTSAAKADAESANAVITEASNKNRAVTNDIYGAMLDVAREKVPLANQQTKGLNDGLRETKTAIDQLIQNEQSDAGKRLLAGLSASETRTKSERAAVDVSEDAEIRAFLDSASKDLSSKTGELTAIEKAMQRGMSALNGDAEASDSAQNRLRSACDVLNKEIAEEFSATKDALSKETIDAIHNQADLEALLKTRTEKLVALEQSQVRQLGVKEQQRFQEASELRDQKIQAILENGSMNFEEKKHAIEQVEAQMRSTLDDLADSAKMTEEELIAIGEKQEETASAVRDSAKVAHSLISAETLVQHDSEAALQADLDRRSSLLLNNVKESMGSIDAAMEAQLAAVAADAEGRIKAVLNDQELSDEEKKKKINMIDSFTREAVADLASNQVAEDHNLTTFASSEMGEEARAEAEMKQLEVTMQRSQTAWAQENARDKAAMAAQTTKVHDLTDSLLTMLEQKAGMSESELEDLNAKQQMALKETTLQAEHAAGDKQAAAKAAAELAEMVAARTKDMSDMTQQELNELEERLDMLAGFSIDAVTQLNRDLEGEKAARDDAMEGGKTYLMQRAGTVIDQLNAVAHILESASTSSLTKQRYVVKKLADVKALVSRLIAETEEVMATGMGDARAKAQGIQEMVDTAQHWEHEYGPRIKANEDEYILTMRGVGGEANAGQEALVAVRGHEAKTLGRQAMSVADGMVSSGDSGSAAGQAAAALAATQEWERTQRAAAEERIGMFNADVEELGKSLGPRAEHIANSSKTMGEFMTSLEGKVDDQEFELSDLEKDLERAAARASSHLQYGEQQPFTPPAGYIPEASSFVQQAAGSLASLATRLLGSVEAQEESGAKLQTRQDSLERELGILEAVELAP